MGALLQGRELAEALMVDTCIGWRAGVSTVDPDTGASTVAYTNVYEGKCRITKGTRAGSRPPEFAVGQTEVVIASSYVQVPFNIDYMMIDDLFEIVTSVSIGMVGRRLRVAVPWMQTMSTMCRYTCQESTEPDAIPT